MNRNTNQPNSGEGRLPAMAPLANPYVPFQLENPPKYEARTALVRGTLFPGLDLPFMGMVNKAEQPVTPTTELQALAFAIQELALYLDTHPEDQEALTLYRNYQTMYHKGMMEYTQRYGPLTHTAPSNAKSYNWLDDPWPWEFAANKED
ncbi:MAG: spore coat protein CotJB [Firmicutes bacterium]|nr:spore coat protein CotJB [Bacillota bacterium]